MTTEELAECLGVARQTVNRWIREQHWKTEKFPGVKGGRARLIHIDASVREFILNIPAFRKLPAFYQAERLSQNMRTRRTVTLIDKLLMPLKICLLRNRKNWRCFYRGKVFADF